MPPKKAAAQAPIDFETLSKACDRMDESPKEEDYKTCLKAMQSTEAKIKILAIQYLSSFCDQFPKQMNETAKCFKAAANDSEEQVQMRVFRGLPNITGISAEDVNEILIAGLSSTNAQIIKDVQGRLKQKLAEDPEFQKTLLSTISTQSETAQANMIAFIRENVTFTEENGSDLIPVLKSAFYSNVKEGLLLFRKNKRFLKEEDWKPLIDELIDRFDAGLNDSEQMDLIIKNLLDPLLDNTRCMGDEASGKLLDVIAVKILPNFAKVEAPVKIVVLQKIADLGNRCTNEQVLKNVYEYAFLPIAKDSQSLNFSIIEAVLFALTRLAKKFPKVTSNLIGTLLVYTGQPGELEGVTEDPERYTDFRDRISNIKDVVQAFIEFWEGEIQKVKGQKDEEGRKAFNNAMHARRTGGNTRKLCSVWLSRKPLQEKAPSYPSWGPVKPKDSKKFDKKKFEKKGDKKTDKKGDKKFDKKADKKGDRKSDKKNRK